MQFSGIKALCSDRLRSVKTSSESRAENASSRDAAPYTFIPFTSRASSSFASGTIHLKIPEAAAVEAAAWTARTPRTFPESSSSPMTRTEDESESESFPLRAWRTASAIAKSKPAPSLRISAGDKLTSTRSGGKSKPEFCTAALMRSRDSFTAPSARPTISTAGMPRRISTSTVTSAPSYPNGENEKICIRIMLPARKISPYKDRP